MSELRTWWGHLSGIAGNALRCWWRLLPLLLAINLTAYVGQQLMLLAAAYLSEVNAWVAVLLVSLGLVGVLSGYVVSLRLIGDELGVRDLIPEAERSEVGQTRSLASLLAITLLPFLGLYAAFGYIQETSGTLVNYETIVRGQLEKGVLAGFAPRTLTEWSTMLAILAGIYVGRRLLDVAHDRTGLRLLGLAAAFVEGFFLFLAFLLASRGVPNLTRWLESREIAWWVTSAKQGFLTALHQISDRLPVIVVDAWTFLWETVWPGFMSALFEPILWLAIAALVFGAKVMNLADLWRQGEPLGASVVAHNATARRWYSRRPATSSRARRVVLEVEEAFFGDLDDKYLPTFQSIRLVLGVGVSFLTAYLALFGVGKAIGEAIPRIVFAIGGGRPSQDWVSWVAVIDTLQVAFSQTLLLCVYGAAFHRAVALFHDKAADSATEQDATRQPSPQARATVVTA